MARPTVLNDDGSLNTADNPAKQGSVIVLFVTGEGLTDPAGVDDHIIGDILPTPRLPLVAFTPYGDCDFAEVVSASGVCGSVAEQIERSEKAVWDMASQRGIPARFQDGYTMRELAEKLHVRRLTVQKWVEAGLLHRKRNGRIDEGSLQSFL